MAGRFLSGSLVCMLAFFCAASHASTPVLPAQVASNVIPGSHTFSPGEEFEFNVHATSSPDGDAVFGPIPFALAGTNAGDFQILSEDCSNASFGTGEFCTVRVRYNGSGQAGNDNVLRVTCSTAAAAAFGPAVVCEGEAGDLLGLFARIAAVAIPLMTPLGTTLLALLMLGFFFFQGLRRSR